MSQPKTTYLKDYQVPPYLIDHVDLTFELGEEVTHVTSVCHVKRNPACKQSRPELMLNGNELVLESVAIEGKVLEETAYQLDDEALVLTSVPDAFTLTIKTAIKPQENTALEGLYKSSGMYCTQCEAEGFRRITYFLDRPDVMSFYTTTIIADKQKYPVLLSNGNRIDEGETEDGRHWAKWHDPFRKPAYLFALVAGDLLHQEDTFVTRSGREVILQIFVEKPNIDKCDHAMASLKKAMKWDEDVFGLEYDLDVYMIVAVNDFNMGAMENKGLNVFNSACILARPETATDADYESIEAIIAHEYFHNWTGNRVTCRDWFQLSLKEGLTVFRDEEFTADMISRPVKRIADVNVLRTSQFPQDASPMAHPIRPASFMDISNFYTVTIYNKGAEVVRMIHTLVGKAGFRKGMDLYFKRHDGQAVTTEDFVAAMADANDIDLTQFKLWYDQAGTPVVHISTAYDQVKKEFALTLKQSCPATPGQDTKHPFHIPVAIGLLGSDGKDMPLRMSDETIAEAGTSHVLELTKTEQTFRFEDVNEKPVLSVLREFSAPVKVEMAYSDEELMFLMANDADDFNRWEAGQRLATRIINRLIAEIDQGVELKSPEGFVKAFSKVLNNESLDKSLVSQALALPNEIYLAEMQDVVNPTAIHQAREFLCRDISSTLASELTNVYERNQLSGDYRFHASDIGSRSLKNICLAYLVRLNSASVRKLAVTQFNGGNNMTDVLSAMSALSNIQCEERGQTLDAFYKKWKHDPLVVDKWFGLQARADHPDQINEIKRLSQHPAFEIKNPNKVRAVVGGFAFGNPVHFHNESGAGYEFVADKIIQLASLNPQISARLANAFGQWKRFDTSRQGLMKEQLQRIKSEKNLPKDVFEIVSKTLGEV